jgi:hypothetical protein
MTTFASGSFDPEAVILSRGAVDRAWRTLPHERQTDRNKNLIADAIVHSAAEGERDPVLLSYFALTTLSLGARHGAL